MGVIPSLQQYPVEVDGVVTRVLEAGSGSDVVVCLHGAGSHADRWRPVFGALVEAGFHVYAMDFPGHGLAAKPEGYAYGTPRFAAATIDLIERLGSGAVSLVGASLGGHVAATVTCRRPDLVQATVLVGATGLVGRSADSAPPGGPDVDGSEEATRARLALLVADRSLITDAWVHEETMISISPGAAAARDELVRYIAEEQDREAVGEAYARLEVPTLLCWGAEDRWIPPTVGVASQKVIPHAELVMVPGAGHAPYLERPGAFTDVVLPFLERHGRPRST